MPADMRQFHAVFFEESFEGLDVMESGLLGLEPAAAAAGDDTIDAIFRAAHSIKGGSGTFGFAGVSELTHVIETLLDQVRGGRRDIDREAIDVLLGSVDCLRGMLTAIQSSSAIDVERVAAAQGALEAMLDDGASGAGSGEEEPDEGEDRAPDHVVHFAPYADMLRTGNEPLRMFRELTELVADTGPGELRVEADPGSLPALAALDPEQIHLRWTLTVPGGVPRERIVAVFEWVEDECDLRVAPVAAATEPPVVAAAPAEPVAGAPAEARSRAGSAGAVPGARVAASQEATSIRVGTDKIDALINKVGELVITQSMITQLGEDFEAGQLERLRDGLAQLQRNTRDLQESVMQIRMLPISFCFNRFPRLVHDLCGKLGKQVELRITGEQTELDKTVLEKLGDPLVHLVRNSLDHGLEAPQARLAAGKPATGVIELEAFHQGGNIVVRISDDGAGLDRERIIAKAVDRGLVEDGGELLDQEIHQLIFEPGFSTARTVSDVSGRGVGMDVVRRNILELGGRIDIRSTAGRGTVITIRLPLTLAILDGQLVRVGDQTYIIPIVSILESLQVRDELTGKVVGQAELYKLRDEYVPIIRLYQAFGVQPTTTDLTRGLLVIVEGDGRKAGIFVDDLLAQQQVVIKSLETNFRAVPGLSGATILGDGKVSMILDVVALIGDASAGGRAPEPGPPDSRQPGSRQRTGDRERLSGEAA